MKDIVREIIRQLFGVRLAPFKPRQGTLILTRYTVGEMARDRIEGETLENAFRFGVEYQAGKIIHKYQRYSIGLWYKAQNPPVKRRGQAEERFVITTCWKDAGKKFC